MGRVFYKQQESISQPGDLAGAMRAPRREAFHDLRWLHAALLVLLPFLPANVVLAQTSWNNLAGGDWTLGSNWTSGAPNGAVTAVIDIPGIGPTLDGSGATADLFVGRTLFGSLTIENGGTLASSNGYLGFQSTASGDVTLTIAKSPAPTLISISISIASTP